MCKLLLQTEWVSSFFMSAIYMTSYHSCKGEDPVILELIILKLFSSHILVKNLLPFDKNDI